MPILCERFTTSKLKEFEDLRSIGTYGFRGEALASISHIAHLRVTTKTAGSSCAWQAHYEAGKLTPAKPGQSADPRPTAGRPGTQITVEDLFYNIPNRRRAFRSSGEEHAKILDVVTRYAVHREGVSFSIKKHGEAGASFSVTAAASKIDRIKQAYGATIARDLIEFKTESDKWGFSASGYCSNANYSGKRTVILLFINHRSVESSLVKRAVEQSYQIFLPKGGHPFIYLSLEIEPARVDVNVHPTKREVHFLSEDEIIDLVCAEVRERLSKVDTTRIMPTQIRIPTLTPTPISRSASHSIDTGGSPTNALPQTPAQKRPYENNLIRTDSKLRKITSMLPSALTPRQSVDENSDDTVVATKEASPNGVTYITTEREQVSVRLSSIKKLRAQVRDAVHEPMTEVFASLTYVGVVDSSRRLVAIQSGVKLYLIDYGMIVNELFYQIGITDFGNFGAMQLRPSTSEPILLKDLLLIAAELEVETDASMADLAPAGIADKVYDQLYSKREMLKEYFSLEISEEGHLLTVPMLMRNYMPGMTKLPTFLLRLGPFVDWTDEMQCFHTFLVELACFYTPERLPMKKRTKRKVKDSASSPSKDHEDVEMPDADQNNDNKQEEEAERPFVAQRRAEIEHALEHALFPAIRSRLLATEGMLDGIVEIANLKGLYKVFERC